FFGILIYYAFLGYVEKPLFLRRSSWMIPFFILAHLLTGKIDEPRQMIPLAFIAIPMAMFFILHGGAGEIGTLGARDGSVRDFSGEPQLEAEQVESRGRAVNPKQPA